MMMVVNCRVSGLVDETIETALATSVVSASDLQKLQWQDCTISAELKRE